MKEKEGQQGSPAIPEQRTSTTMMEKQRKDATDKEFEQTQSNMSKHINQTRKQTRS